MAKHSESPLIEKQMLDLTSDVYECERCEQFRASRSKGIKPISMFGSFDRKIWVVALNPGLEAEGEGLVFNDFDSYINRWRNYEFQRGFFTKIQKVLPEGIKLGRDVAVVDLVKCATKGISKDFSKLASKCGYFLECQIKIAKPELIIADGIAVCHWFMSQNWGKVRQNDTSVLFHLDDFETRVVLSGFIGQIDRYSKTRLKKELQLAVDELGLGR